MRPSRKRARKNCPASVTTRTRSPHSSSSAVGGLPLRLPSPLPPGGLSPSSITSVTSPLSEASAAENMPRGAWASGITSPA
eukprot:92028-Chlamydomonas_euryale.AAC.1